MSQIRNIRGYGKSQDSASYQALSLLADIYCEPGLLATLLEEEPVAFYKILGSVDYKDWLFEEDERPNDLWIPTVLHGCAMIASNNNKRAASQVANLLNGSIIRIAAIPLCAKYRGQHDLTESRRRWDIVLAAYKVPSELWPRWIMHAETEEVLLDLIEQASANAEG